MSTDLDVGAGTVHTQSISRRSLLAGTFAAGSLPWAAVAKPAHAAFEPTWQSLTSGYRAPDWFRDAKFGIWAHWSPQCVPEAGDWYARDMYLQGSRASDFHRRTYGHPCDTGYIDVVGRWKAERWEPAALLDLYQRAGARYFMALANHHDNVDCYASSHHEWNTLRIGPKRDIVGTWAKLARERGLRFGVSNHSAHAWHWLQPAYGYDPEGPRRGERYDAARLTRADGRGKWWDGLDPQALYTGRTMPLPDGFRSIEKANAWHEANDRVWTEKAPVKNPAFTARWRARCRELIDRYRPDILYFDDFGLPLEAAGLEMTAHLYNSSLAWHDGRLEAVVNAKLLTAAQRPGLIEDVERGSKTAIDPIPWQTDTCLGNWHYDRALYEDDGYKGASTVIHMLCDVVAKNGNLLLSVPMRGDGTIDEKEERIVREIGDWMRVWGDAIYATRPWTHFGEGPTSAGAGMFAETQRSAYGARDIRYVVRGPRLHALVLGWPRDGKVRLTLLGTKTRGDIARVTLAGDETPLAFSRSNAALTVEVPSSRRNEIGLALAIDGNGIV